MSNRLIIDLTQKYTKEYVIDKIHESNPLVDIIGNYIDTRTSVKAICNECGNIWNANPERLMRGHHCPKCAINNRLLDHLGKNRKTNDEFIKELSFKNPTVVPLSEYINARTKVKYQCKLCGSIHEAKASNLLSSFACPDCGNKSCSAKQRKTNDRFLFELSERNPNVIPLDKYDGNTNKIRVSCKVCGYEWSAMPVNLIRNDGLATGCPRCRQSHGEKYINDFLTKHNIRFIPQYKYDDLIGVGGRQLSYDFYLIDYNTLIEYQGEFHDGTSRIQEPDDYSIQIEHDRRKKEYADSHSIRLETIWYFDNKEEKMNMILHNITDPVTTTAS